jgi:membrane associated rhomboid family serine protease
MSYYRQENRRSRLTVGQDGNALITLIAVNLIVFSMLALIKVVYIFSAGSGNEGMQAFDNNILKWVTMPADLTSLVHRPWTILTHMFVHDSVWRIIANMLWLWAFGYILQDLAGNRKIVPIFLYGALAGAIAYVAAYNLIPGLHRHIETAYTLDASAGIMAIAIATTLMAPNYRIFPMINGGIPLWVVTMIYVIIDLATLSYSDFGGHISHISSAGMGYLFVLMLNKGYDWSNWMNNVFDWTNNLFNPDVPKKGKSIKTDLFYKSTVAPYKKTSALNQQKIDELLDKINQKGYNSLTQDEKDLLKRASMEDL